MYYINYRYENGPIETIEAEESYKEAKRLLNEYRGIAGNYWISRRATKDYYNSLKN